MRLQRLILDAENGFRSTSTSHGAEGYENGPRKRRSRSSNKIKKNYLL